MCDNAPSYVVKLKGGKKSWEKKAEPTGQGYMGDKKDKDNQKAKNMN